MPENKRDFKDRLHKLEVIIQEESLVVAVMKSYLIKFSLDKIDNSLGM